MTAIAITGMACRYAEARSPRQLWENVLAQRQSFRRIPAVRLRVEDYASDYNGESISVQMAAVLEDYEFDRVRFHLSRETFVSTDLVHWLALDVASQALEDAKLLDLGNSQRERVGVYIGNSLTGEFSRANLLRLRWPYVRRVLAAALQQKNICGSNAQIEDLLDAVEERYKAPFPATTEDSLAGGLANTIAGRICNHFNFKGGGYTVDGACASSLLAVTTACSALESGDVDIAIAGGVDLSLDPFELAGFSKLGALAGEKMRVFDEHSSGFWPGEGCGMVVLMRHEDAVAAQHLPYAVIRGWGVSSDGSGGMTRPEASGQMLALKRSYQRAGYGIDSVTYFEGHGTGTSVGDAAELQALSMARCEAKPCAVPAAIGSIKANIGHTKAAAGVAGLIKATLAAKARIVPPVTGCDTPHPELTVGKPMLRVPREGELWPENVPVRASVSAMGFGGINTHVALEAADTFHRKNFTGSERQQLSSTQDCELFLFHAADLSELSVRLEEMLSYAGQISYSEMTDLAASLVNNLPESGHGVRAACVASTPARLDENLRKLREWCASGIEHSGTKQKLDSSHGIFLGAGDTAPRIGFLFPGQGSPVYTNGGIWSRRFSQVRDLYRSAHLPLQQTVATETAQPCVVTASLAGLLVLDACGLEATVALGHSLGELTALCWGGACEKEDLLRVVAERGRVMAQKGAASGAMASIRADAQEVKRRLNGDRLVIAAYNSPQQTVVSGDAQALEGFLARLNSAGVNSTRLPVSHAFHSPLVEDVATAFSDYLSIEDFNGVRRRVVSTVTGTALADNADLRELLATQITSPVRFADAVAVAAKETDLFIEVGPGAVLTGIAAECSDKPVVAMNCGSESLRGLLSAVGAAFAMGANVRASALFESRFYRPFQAQHTFLANPCESAASYAAPARSTKGVAAESMSVHTAMGNSAIEILRQLVATRTELPLATVKPENRFLDDLHLNSITVGQLVLEAAAQLGLPAPAAPTEYANATLAETAATLEEIKRNAPAQEQEKFPQGVDVWTRVLSVELIEQELRKGKRQAAGHWEIVAMDNGALGKSLEQEFRTVSNSGMVCIVPEQHDERSAAFLLEFTQTALKQKVEYVMFVQHEPHGGATALARTLFLENAAIHVKVVVIPREHPDAAAWIAAEAVCSARFAEAHYDRAGIRREPRLKLLWPEADSANMGQSLGGEDVLLVTGGGKGIAAECALELARDTGCALALVGRSDAERDQELKQNLLRMAHAGVRFGYFAADVTDKESVAFVISEIERDLGKVTAVLHGAGVNHPKRLEEITPADLHDTLTPKIAGLENILDRVGAHPLRLLITFGSIIGRSGLQGEGHYALANDWLGRTVEEWQQAHPHCRCLNLEWSVWAGAGMGQKLGVLDALVRQGITPLPMGEAIATLKSVLAARELPVSTIVTGRFGNLPTLRFEHAELPLQRFLEHVQVHYPGIELVADAVLNADTDPYVAEHAFQGEQLFPAVCGIEAMAQAAMALQQTERPPHFHHVRFEQPIVVPGNKSVRIRIAALRRKPETVSVVVRCSSTGFHVDHFSAECSFDSKENKFEVFPARPKAEIALNIVRDVYDGLLFHQGRFRRIDHYETLEAACSVAVMRSPIGSPWFARHLPQQFVMGDPASRDAAIHSIQACIPHKTVLPVGVDEIIASAGWTNGPATIHAVERVRDGDNFIYDLEIRDLQGKVCESWQGLHLRAVAPIARSTPWPLPLLGPYLERRSSELLVSAPMKVTITIGSSSQQEREQRSAEIVRRTFGANALLIHRPDGKPEVVSSEDSEASVAVAELSPQVSLAHAASLTLLVSGEPPLGCDMEQVIARDVHTWQGLLGSDALALAQLMAGKPGCSLDLAATQLWTLKESLRKAGASLDQSLCVESHSSDQWTVLRSGAFAAATFHAGVEGFDSEFAFGFVISRTQ